MTPDSPIIATVPLDAGRTRYARRGFTRRRVHSGSARIRGSIPAAIRPGCQPRATWLPA